MDFFKITGERNFEFSVPLMKYDERTGEFEGYMAVEEIDKVKEMIDLDKSLPFFEEWQSGFAKATDGASFGNVREQHDSKKAAGKLLAPLEKTTTEDGKPAWKVRGVAVDPVTKQKLSERVLCALSIGGEYTEKSKADDNGVVRYVARPNEVSLVDNPCMPSAKITVVKADGSQTIAKAVGFQPEQGWKCRAGWEHGHARKEEAKACDGSTTSHPTSQETVEITKSVEETATVTEPDAKLTAAIGNGEDVLTGLAGLLNTTTENLTSAIKSLYVPSSNGSSSTQSNKEVTMSDTKDEKEKAPVEKTDDGALAKVESAIAKGFADLTKTFNARFEKQDERAEKIEKSVTETREASDKQIAALAGALAKAFAMITDVKVDNDGDLEQVFKAIEEKPAKPKAVARAVSKSEDTRSSVEEVEKIDYTKMSEAEKTANASKILMQHAIPVGGFPASA